MHLGGGLNRRLASTIRLASKIRLASTIRLVSTDYLPVLKQCNSSHLFLSSWRAKAEGESLRWKGSEALRSNFKEENGGAYDAKRNHLKESSHVLMEDTNLVELLEFNNNRLLAADSLAIVQSIKSISLDLCCAYQAPWAFPTEHLCIMVCPFSTKSFQHTLLSTRTLILR